MEEGLWGDAETSSDDGGVEFHACVERGVSSAGSKKGTEVASERREGWPSHMKES